MTAARNSALRLLQGVHLASVIQAHGGASAAPSGRRRDLIRCCRRGDRKRTVSKVVVFVARRSQKIGRTSVTNDTRRRGHKKAWRKTQPCGGRFAPYCAWGCQLPGAGSEHPWSPGSLVRAARSMYCRILPRYSAIQETMLTHPYTHVGSVAAKVARVNATFTRQ